MIRKLAALAALIAFIAPATEAQIRDRFTRALTAGNRAACTSRVAPLPVEGSMELDVFCYSVVLDKDMLVRFSATDASRVLRDLPAGTPFMVVEGSSHEGVLHAQRWRKVRLRRDRIRDIVRTLATRNATLHLAAAYHDQPEVLARLAAAHPGEAMVFASKFDVLGENMIELGLRERPAASACTEDPMLSSCMGEGAAVERQLAVCQENLDGAGALIQRAHAACSDMAKLSNDFDIPNHHITLDDKIGECLAIANQ